jgi:protocatechuate 3,4-dioxygenase beta subunit
MNRDTATHDRGLAFDLSTLLRRRRVLGLIGGAGLAAVAGCTGGSGDASTDAGGQATTTNTPTASGASCQRIPAETAGPFPGDGSNGPNILTRSGIVRSDITSSFGAASGVAKGVPLTINLTILNTAQGCAPYAGAAVYLWHCDMNGGYSMYSQGITDENYLRGVQEADAKGAVTFTSIFPAAYSGRWPHIHFEIYPSLAKATAQGNKVSISQLALPAAACEAVYATDGYATSVTAMARTSLGSDSVFRDGYAQQLATVTGGVAAGYIASLAVPV